MTEAILREEAGNQIAVQYVETKLAANVNVTDQTARQFYDRNKSEMTAPERVHLRHIVIQVLPKTSEADKAKAKAKAEEVTRRCRRARTSPSWRHSTPTIPARRPAAAISASSSRGRPCPPSRRPPLRCKPNEIAPLTETRFGYHIIQLLERQPGARSPSTR